MSNMKETALALVPRSLNEVQLLAIEIAKSTLLPDALRGKASDVLVSIMTGAELGLSPMSSIRGVSIIQGKPVLNASTQVGLVKGSGLAEYFVCVEDTDKVSTWETKRKGEPIVQRTTWTIDDAKRAGLYPSRDNWRAYPRAMLSARASSELARKVYPDLLAGVYDPDEVGVQSPIEAAATRHDLKTSDVVDVEFIETKAPVTTEQTTTATADASLNEIAGALVASIYATTTLDDLTPLKVEAERIPKGTAARKSVVAAIKQQDAKLKLAQLSPVVDAANDTQPTAEATAS